MTFTLLCTAFLLSGSAAPADEIPAQKLRWLQTMSRRFMPVKDRTSARDLFHFALEATCMNWRPDLVERALQVAERMQDRDSHSTTYGNFRWYWHNEQPVDRNAVEFCMEKGILLRKYHAHQLTSEARTCLDRLIRYSVEGIRRHRVSVAYTNIFLMRTWNMIAIGEATGRPDLAEEGYQALDHWLLYTWECGIREYLSPTYYGVDLGSLGLIANHASRAKACHAAEAALRFMWTDVAANWFAPGERLGGAHSRDYDYLTGHSLLDGLVRRHGWIDGSIRPPKDTFQRYSAWQPPASIRKEVATLLPRFVRQRWGSHPWETAAHHVGRRFSIGSAGATYGPMDKTLTVNLPGGPQAPVVNFFMDVRGDPYGKKRFPQGTSGHNKALHAEPFLTSVQRGPEVVLLAAGAPGNPRFARWLESPSCLLSHLVFPLSATVWVGDETLDLKPDRSSHRVAPGQAVFLRVEDVAVGVRVLVADNGAEGIAPVELSADGHAHGAGRLTCIHSSSRPHRDRYVVALWIRAAEGLDSRAFAQFRRLFSAAPIKHRTSGGRVDLSVSGLAGPLQLTADVANGIRLAQRGAEDGADASLLAVNGRDLGREILGNVGPIPRVRRIMQQIERGEAAASRAERVVQAEDAAYLAPPFRVDKAPDAEGGSFVWVPGEPDLKGGAPLARALYVLHVPEAGTYRLWGRIQAPTPNDDSFSLSIRQRRKVVVPRSAWHTGVAKKWTWRRVTTEETRGTHVPLTLTLEAGTVLIELRCREDGTRLDALYLTRKAASPRT